MNWSIDFSKDADKFLTKNPQAEKKIIDEIKKFIQKYNGETVSIDIKKLTGNWQGYYRIRKGKIRIIIELNSLKNTVYVENIDFRGDVYK